MNTSVNKVMNAREFRWILKRTGYTQTELADFIKKSRQFVSTLCSSDEDVPLRYVNSLIELVGVEHFTISQAEWYKSENSRHRRNLEGWLFHPHLEEFLPPEFRPNHSSTPCTIRIGRAISGRCLWKDK
jgi:hypothetical protein